MSQKPVIIFAFPDCIGGVASFNRNLINYTTFKQQCHIRVILLHDTDARRDPFMDKIEADEVIRFEFSVFENQFSVCKRLNLLLGEEKGCIVADNSLVLNTIGLFGANKRVIYLVHDFFYVRWALEYGSLIDGAIAHSSFFRDILLAASVNEYQAKAFYIPYGVERPQEKWVKRLPGETLKLVFLGRLVKEKGVLLLREIDRLLQEKGVPVNWTIIGKGPLLDTIKKQWEGIDYVQFIQATDTRQVYSCLEEQDILVFPSQFEGTPVSIMEALSRGAVPVVSDLPGGTRDMVKEDIGVLCSTLDARAYANAIEHFKLHPDTLQEMQQSCIKKGKEVYNVDKAADAYFSFLMEQAGFPVNHVPSGLHYYSRMDKKLWPNWLVFRLRKMRKKIASN